MQPEERQQRIESYLQRVEFASLDELSEDLDVSPSTIRRDLMLLEGKGSLRRTHGGARLVNPKTDEFLFSARDTHEASEKEAIGRAVASLIKPGQSVIMDAGTTVFHVAKELGDKTAHLITNSLPIANLHASNSKVEVVLSGGVIYPRLGVLVGPLAVESFSKMHADVAIMSSGGITLEGVTNSHGLLIDIQRAMINAVERVIFCLDHTKFGRKSMSFLCELDCIDVIVTNQGAPGELVNGLRQKDLEVIVAGKSDN